LSEPTAWDVVAHVFLSLCSSQSSKSIAQIHLKIQPYAIWFAPTVAIMAATVIAAANPKYFCFIALSPRGYYIKTVTNFKIDTHFGIRGLWYNLWHNLRTVRIFLPEVLCD
jgi:hypothetical protein